MSSPAPRVRGLAVWSLVTAVAGLGGRALLPDLGDLTELAGAAAPAFDQLLVTLCAVVLVACLAWAWLVTTVVVGEVLLRRTGSPQSPGVPTWARRLVLAACGTALVVGAAPAGATSAPLAGPRAAVEVGVGVGLRAGGPVADLDLGGLPFPDRPSGTGAPAVPRPPLGSGPAGQEADSDYEVRTGDSLWAIAEQTLARRPGGERPDPAEVADLVARTYGHNRAVVGADPDLIVPGQQLHLPPP